MASITQLFDDLCEALLPAAQARPGQRSVNRKRAKRSLKRVAYNALFANLFQEDTHQRQPDSSKLPVKNKVLMLSLKCCVENGITSLTTSMQAETYPTAATIAMT